MGVSGPFYRPRTIETIPDDPLLEIFGFYVEAAYKLYYPNEFDGIGYLEEWFTLIHVCRRWRSLVFASPCRLRLRLVCTRGRPVREMLDIWPTLPIVVDDEDLSCYQRPRMEHFDSVTAALKHRNRVCQISLQNIPSSLFPNFMEMMQESFPRLTRLHLVAVIESPMLHPDPFLGGSTPRLRSLTLERIPFPELPKLLLSTKDLVELRLCDIPYSGYISPSAMVTCLSSLARLEILDISFVPRRSSLTGSNHHLSSSTCIDLPALTELYFEGVNEYIDVVARINAPLLRNIWIDFFDRPLFDNSQLAQFVHRIETFKTPHRIVVDFDRHNTNAQFLLNEYPSNGTTLEFFVSCASLEWQLPLMTALFSSSSSPFQLSSLERLDISNTDPLHEDWDADTDIQFLELLRPFTAVKGLYTRTQSTYRTQPALQLARILHELAGERVAEVLPALEDIFISEHHLLGVAQEAMRPFITARQLSGRPVTVHHWK